MAAMPRLAPVCRAALSMPPTAPPAPGGAALGHSSDQRGQGERDAETGQQQPSGQPAVRRPGPRGRCEHGAPGGEQHEPAEHRRPSAPRLATIRPASGGFTANGIVSGRKASPVSSADMPRSVSSRGSTKRLPAKAKLTAAPAARPARAAPAPSSARFSTGAVLRRSSRAKAAPVTAAPPSAAAVCGQAAAPAAMSPS